jgi:hypothetical protein
VKKLIKLSKMYQSRLIISFFAVFFIVFNSFALAGHKHGSDRHINPAGIVTGSGGVGVSGIVSPSAFTAHNSIKSVQQTGSVNPAGVIRGSGGISARAQTSFTAGKRGSGAGNKSSGLGFGSKGAGGNNSLDKAGCAKIAGNNVFVGTAGSNVVIKLPNPHLNNFSNKANKCGLGAADSFAMAIDGIEQLTFCAGAKGQNPGKGNLDVKLRKDGYPGNPGGGNGNGHWGEGNHGNGKGNIFCGNQGHGVGEGMTCGGCKPKPKPCPKPCPKPKPPCPKPKPPCPKPKPPCPKPKPPKPPCPEPEPEPEPTFATAAAPVPLVRFPEVLGCPAVISAATEEVGVPPQAIQLWIGKSLASNIDIQPCDVCSRIVEAAAVLRDSDGSRFAALAEIINSIAPADMPFSPEFGVQIVESLRQMSDEDNRYAVALEYMDAFVEYANILEKELPGLVDSPVEFVMAKYGSSIIDDDNANIATFVAMQLQTVEQ